MKRLSRLTALLLTLVLILSPSLSAVAETVDAIKTRNAYFEAAKLALQNAILGIDEYADYRAIADLIEVDIFDEFYDSLEEDIQKEMLDLVIEKFWESCISSNKVGPFLPPVDVRGSAASSYSMRSMDVSVTDTTGDKEGDLVKNGLILKKSATPVANTTDKFTVELEAYVTGNVEIIENKSMIPADIVLVLDCSNSMVQNTMDDATGDTRAVALKKAVVAFIEDIRDKFNEETADHRITIYRYNNAVNAIPDNDTLKVTAENNNGWTYVNATGAKHLIDQVNSMGNDSGTHTDKGMDAAYNQIVTNYSYIGKAENYERQKVVVVFTDGLPTDKSLYYQGGTVAVDAINKAYDIKNAVDDDGNPQNITVYSVAIFSGANPAAELRDGKTDDTRFRNDEDRINALMHAISSNYPEATAEDNDELWDHDYYVTYGTGSNKGYYITANSTDDLINKFKEISSNIETGKADQELGTSTTVKDIVTPQFMLPEGASNVRVKKVVATAYNSTTHEGTWDTNNAVTLPSSSVSINAADRSITVTGFDFAQNYVTQTARTDPENVVRNNYHGRKLVISFEVTANEDFLGGLDVPTNTNAGVYVPEGEGTKEVEVYTKPVVDIPVKPITPTVQDQHIYLSTKASLREMLCKDEDDLLTYTVNGTQYKVDGINNAYVDITYVFKDKAGNVIATYVIPKGERKNGNAPVGNVDGYFVDENGKPMLDANGNPIDVCPLLTEDTTYSIECTVDAGTKNGTSYSTTTKVEATVFVYHPVLTFADSAVKYGDPINITEDDYYEANDYKSVVWKHATKGSAVADNMLSDEPGLTLTYTADDNWITAGKVTGKRDVVVQVTRVVSSGNDIGDTSDDMVLTDYVVGQVDKPSANYTYGNRMACNTNHTVGETLDHTLWDLNYEFMVHILEVDGNLAVTKVVDPGEDENKNPRTIPESIYTADTEFKFTVSLMKKDANGEYTEPLEGAYQLYKGTSLDNVTAVSGVKITNGGTFTLKNGEFAVIKDLPMDTQYGVVEETKLGFIGTREVTDESNNGTQRIIDAGKTDLVTYRNTYSPENLIISKKVVKPNGTTVTNDSNLNDDEFWFNVTLPNGMYDYSYTKIVNGQTEDESIKVEISDANPTCRVPVYANRTGQFSNLPVNGQYIIQEEKTFAQTGYEFKEVKEIKGSGNTTVDADNAKITGEISSNGAEVEFTNVYTTYNLTIDKVVEGAEAGDTNIDDDVFTVNVKLPVGKYSITGADYGEGAVLNFTNQVKEIPVTVTNGTNTVIYGIPQGAEYAVEEDTSKMPEGYTPKSHSANATGTLASDTTVTVTNTYETGTLTVAKKVVGKFVAGEKFNFTVKLPHGTYPCNIPGDNGTVIKEVVIDETGYKTFKLADGQTAVIYRIPVKATYEVRETELSNYDTVFSHNGATPVSQPMNSGYVTGTMDKDGEALEYTNTHKTGGLEIAKVVDNVTSTEKFTFTITVNYVNDWAEDITMNGIIKRKDGKEDAVVLPVLSNGMSAVSSYKLSDGERLIILGLPYGAHCQVSEQLADDDPVYKVDNKLQEGYIPDGGTLAFKFNNTRGLGDLKISKQIITTDAAGASETDEFTFTVTLTPPYKENKPEENITLNDIYEYVKSDSGIADASFRKDGNNLVVTFKLKHDDSIIIKDLPVGTIYEVKESAHEDYNTEYVGEEGEIAAATTKEAAFTNTHKYGKLVITKKRAYYAEDGEYKDEATGIGYTLTRENDIPWYVANSFSFKVELTDRNGNALTSEQLNNIQCTIKGYTSEGVPFTKTQRVTANIDLGHNWTATIDNLPPGTKYTVTEAVPTGYLCIPNTNKHTGDITAGDSDEAPFVNVYRPAALSITKKIVDEDGATVSGGNVADDQFKFKVWLPEGEYPVTITGPNGSNSVTCERLTEGTQEKEALYQDKSGNWYFYAVGGEKSEDGEYIPEERIFYVFTYNGAKSNISINGIPFNSEYYVEEIELPYGYELKADVNNPNPRDTELVEEIKNEIFTNVYSTRALTIEKKIVGADGQNVTDENVTDDEFRVYVDVPAGNYKVKVGNNEAYTKSFTGTNDFIDIVGASTVVISDIPKRAPYTVKETDDLPNGYTLESYSPAAVDGKVSGTLSDDANVEITNKYVFGTLTINKQVVGNDAPADAEFEFTIGFYTMQGGKVQTGSFPYTVKKKDGTEVSSGTVTGGSLKIKLKHDETVTITEVPDNTFYSVTETRDTNNYTIMIDGTSSPTGNVVGYITQRGKSHVYTNTYQFGHLKITKKFANGYTPEPGETFVFTVKDNNKLVAEIVMTGADFHNGELSVMIEHLPIGKTYTVTENEAWSWRYSVEVKYPDSAIVTSSNNPEWIFTNTKVNDQWLDDSASADNNMSDGSAKRN